MGNAHVKPHPRSRNNKKQVHWKAADRPSPPGKPHLAADNEVSPDLVTIRWSKPIRDGGSPITGYLVEHRRTGSPSWVRATPLLVQFPELSIGGLEPGWRYQFRVSAENAVGLSEPSDVSEPLTVTLQKFAVTAPKFTDELKDITALENDKVEFIVHFLGQPNPKVCWFKDGFEIFSSRRTRILTEADRSILTIHQSALADEGEIKCTATNKAGHASTKARLSLEAPPSIRLPRQYEDGLLFEIGEVIRLKVSVAGRPTPLIFWSHNGETIQNNDRYEIEYVDRSSVLKIGEALRGDRGEYQIKAVNKIGQDISSFLVTITDKPAPPGKARVVMTLGRSVTLSWNTPSDDGGCKIGNYIIEYYRLGWNVWLKAATSRQLSTILGDLIEGSEYKFRIKAESPYGVSEPSEESDIVFIPDHKRGITTPQIRSRSQPRDIIDEIAIPVAIKRKHKPRSLSTTPTFDQHNIITDNEGVPKRPERTKPKTPEAVRKHIAPIIDRASIARDLSYGTDIRNLKSDHITTTVLGKKERGPSPSAVVQRRKSPSPLVPSPDPSRTPSPRKELTEQAKQKSPSPNIAASDSRSPDFKAQPKVLSRENAENLGGSSEFMLVLYPDANENDQRKEMDLFEFDDSDIPPPLSLSAPELGIEPPTFNFLKSAFSSSELLHERAMIRFNEAAAFEEAEASLLSDKNKLARDHSVDIPKIQINSKDTQDIVGLERKSSFRRRSVGGVVQQQALWAQRRLSLKNNTDLTDLVENQLKKSPSSVHGGTLDEKRETMMRRQRSDSQEMEEEEFKRVRAKVGAQLSFEKGSIDVVDEDKWMEDYEESIPSSGEEEEEEESVSSDEEHGSLEQELPTRRKIYSDEDEEDDEMYHPGIMSVVRKSTASTDEPFEVLKNRNVLPDPSFVPRPILKKSDLVVPQSSKTGSHSPIPKGRPEGTKARQRSFSLVSPDNKILEVEIDNSGGQRKRSFSLIPQEDSPIKLSPSSSKTSVSPQNQESEILKMLKAMPVAPGHNISAVAQLTGITAASIVIPQNLLNKMKAEEEAKVVADHYGDIVRTVSLKKRTFPHITSLEKEQLHESKSTYHQSEARNSSITEEATPGVSSKKRTFPPIASIEKEQPHESRSSYQQPDARKGSITEETSSSVEVTKAYITYTPVQERRESVSDNKSPHNREIAVAQERKASITSSELPKLSQECKASITSSSEDVIKRERKSSTSSSKETVRKTSISEASSSRERKSILTPDPPHSRRSTTPQRGRTFNQTGHGKTSKRSQTPSKPIEKNWSGDRRASPSPVPNKLRNKSPSPIPYSKPRPMLREIMTQTSVGFEIELRSSGTSTTRDDLVKVENKVKSVVDYITDLAMFAVACWFYLFSNELFAIPVLLIMVYRQLKDAIRKRIPGWIVKRFDRSKRKSIKK